MKEDPTLLPDGGVIISFLAHEYPNLSQEGCGMLAQELTHFLKGNDRTLFQIAKALDLSPETKAFISGNSQDSGFTVLSATDGMCDFSEPEDEITTLDDILRSLVDRERGDFREGDDDWETCVIFLNGESEAGTQWREQYATYGNDPVIDFVYVQAILVMHVPDWGSVGRGGYRREFNSFSALPFKGWYQLCLDAGLAHLYPIFWQWKDRFDL